MCGIVGIISKETKELVPNAITALRDLEYRGYDSAGLGFVHDHKIKTYKVLGAPSENLHQNEIYTSTKMGKDPNITTIIGHSRWATHGKPAIKNAHPHTDCTGRIAVVHNGTILNFETLKKALISQGHTFTSDTDTEVIAHSIEEALKHEKSFEEAFVHAVRMLEGSFGIVAIDLQSPQKLFVAKNGSPLNIGMTEDSFVVASSVNALLRYTSQYISLSDKEFAVLSAEKNLLTQHTYQFKNKTQTNKEFKPIKGASVDDISKNGFETFMLKEVYEQPETSEKTLLGRYNKHTGDAVLGGFADFEHMLKNVHTICTVACGTAHNAGKVGKEIIESLTDIIVCNEIASEFRYKKHNFKPDNSLILAISQSGETADTLEALKEAKRKEFTTFGIVNVVGSAISTQTDAGEYTRAGSEIGVASTKAFTSQLVVLYLLALKLARANGFTPQAGKQYIQALESMPNHMRDVLSQAKDIQKIARMFKQIKSISFLGRGIHVPIADEAALKFKELTYMEAGSYPLGELKHGPIAVVDKDHLSVIIMPKDDLFALSKNSIEQILSKGGKVLIITDNSAKNDPIIKKADATIFLPTLKQPIFYPLLEILPLQLFSYYFTKLLGNNADKPRNLAKSVTVE
jgi:glucosamine--fructose-6-phosphate aminotransferase (isomerizing)